jgi:N utilization substance protein A
MVTTELRGEKVDIVPFSDDPAEFVARALQPAKVKEVLLDEERGRATVIVHDYQLSLAIGKEGQNARLAARLTGWHIDIRSESELAAEQAAFEQADWAEGEWVEDDSGEMVWRPAEGGESVSAEQWAAGGTDEEPAEAVAEVVAEVEAEADFVAEVVGEAKDEVAAETEVEGELEAEAELEEEDEELEEVSVELELSAEDETEYPGIGTDTPSTEA